MLIYTASKQSPVVMPVRPLHLSVLSAGLNVWLLPRGSIVDQQSVHHTPRILANGIVAGRNRQNFLFPYTWNGEISGCQFQPSQAGGHFLFFLPRPASSAPE